MQIGEFVVLTLLATFGDATCPPPHCGPHEVPTDCWHDCVPACNRREPFCPTDACFGKGCFCAEGYMRRDSQERNSPCIHISKCPGAVNTERNVQHSD